MERRISPPARLVASGLMAGAVGVLGAVAAPSAFAESADAPTSAFDLAVRVTSERTQLPSAGGSATYLVSVANNGPDQAVATADNPITMTDLVAQELVSDGLTASIVPPKDWDCGAGLGQSAAPLESGEFVCFLANGKAIADNAPAKFEISVQIPDGLSADAVLTNSAVVFGDETTGGDLENNADEWVFGDIDLAAEFAIAAPDGLGQDSTGKRVDWDAQMAGTQGVDAYAGPGSLRQVRLTVANNGLGRAGSVAFELSGTTEYVPDLLDAVVNGEPQNMDPFCRLIANADPESGSPTSLHCELAGVLVKGSQSDGSLAGGESVDIAFPIRLTGINTANKNYSTTATISSTANESVTRRRDNAATVAVAVAAARAEADPVVAALEQAAEEGTAKADAPKATTSEPESADETTGAGVSDEPTPTESSEAESSSAESHGAEMAAATAKPLSTTGEEAASEPPAAEATTAATESSASTTSDAAASSSAPPSAAPIDPVVELDSSRDVPAAPSADPASTVAKPTGQPSATDSAASTATESTPVDQSTAPEQSASRPASTTEPAAVQPSATTQSTPTPTSTSTVPAKATPKRKASKAPTVPQSSAAPVPTITTSAVPTPTTSATPEPNLTVEAWKPSIAKTADSTAPVQLNQAPASQAPGLAETEEAPIAGVRNGGIALAVCAAAALVVGLVRLIRRPEAE